MAASGRSRRFKVGQAGCQGPEPVEACGGGVRPFDEAIRGDGTATLPVGDRWKVDAAG